MASTLEIEQRCSRVVLNLEYVALDEICLLRSARLLKPVIVQLERTLQERKRAGESTIDINRAEAALKRVEGHLRLVLLDYPSMERWEMVNHVKQAADQLLLVLLLLE